jgi:hypothetical protein
MWIHFRKLAENKEKLNNLCKFVLKLNFRNAINDHIHIILYQYVLHGVLQLTLHSMSITITSCITRTKYSDLGTSYIRSSYLSNFDT